MRVLAPAGGLTGSAIWFGGDTLVVSATWAPGAGGRSFRPIPALAGWKFPVDGQV